MLVKLEENSYINMDYVINLFLVPGHIFLEMREWSIVAKMIDGSKINLLTYDNENEAKNKFRKIIERANYK